MNTTEITLGQTVRMRKAHACGNDIFIVMRVGADVKIKCVRCGHVVMLDRITFNKRFKCTIQDID